MCEQKTIRFIDTHYNVLFTVPDGGNIALTNSASETVIRKCEYLDAYHTKIGSNVFHICEFAELMERNGATCAPEQPVALPEKDRKRVSVQERLQTSVKPQRNSSIHKKRTHSEPER